MKQRLNDSDLDRQLKRKMVEAESMPPAFDKLFPAQPHNFRFSKFSNLFAFSFLVISVVISVSNQNESPVQSLVSNSNSTVLAEIPNKTLSSKYEGGPASFNEEIIKSKAFQKNASSKTVTNKNGELGIGKPKESLAKSIFPTRSEENNNPISSKENPIRLNDSEDERQLLALSSVSAGRELVASNFEKLTVPKIEYNFIKSKQKQEGKQSWTNNLFIGITSSVENTWILNQNTYNEFDGYEFAYKVDWGYQYGFRMGYNPVKGVGFELAYIPVSTKGQRYEDVIHFENKTREVDLEYSKIPFKLKWRHPLSQNNRISLNWELGGAYSILHTAYQNNNGKVGEITDRFNKHVWQANTGLMADFDLNKRVFISAGLQASISEDINAPKWQANDSYGKSHTFTWGLQLGISRRL